MLTNAKREWLVRRKNFCFRCFSGFKIGHVTNILTALKKIVQNLIQRCASPENVDFEDAAEFEARVAAYLSRLAIEQPWPDLWPECISCKRHAKDGDAACLPCVLKDARLIVEDEMEKKI